jgi:hypothetical protein
MQFLDNLFCGRFIADEKQKQALVDIADAQAEAAIRDKVKAQADLKAINDQLQQTITLAAQDKSQTLQALNNLQNVVAGITEQKNNLETALLACTSAKPYFSVLDQLPASTQKLARGYMDKYPEANIAYRGRIWGKAQIGYDLDVKVWLQSGQNDAKIVSRVKGANAYVSDILKQNPGISAHQACDMAVMRVSCGFWKPYGYDKDNFGVDEYWQFASEMEVGQSGDCDDSAIWRYVGCRIAGVPAELMRFATGITNNGQGHATNHYLASDLLWHHINSTSAFSNTDKATSTPLNHDPNEQLGLATIWFSANELKTFSTYATYASDENANKKFKIGDE